MIKCLQAIEIYIFSHFSCTPVRTCVNGRYAPEFREVLKITANYLWQSVPGHKCTAT